MFCTHLLEGFCTRSLEGKSIKAQKRFSIQKIAKTTLAKNEKRKILDFLPFKVLLQAFKFYP